MGEDRERQSELGAGKSNSVPHKSVFDGGQLSRWLARSLAHVSVLGLGGRSVPRPDPTGGGGGET